MISFATSSAREAPASQGALRLLAAVSEPGSLDVRFERIVERATETLHGLEALCRVRHEELPRQPVRLFELAEEVECAAELSEILRRRAAAAMTESSARLFLNTHPAEFRDIGRLLRSLDELRARWPALSLVLEIHEEACPTIEELEDLRRELDRLGIEVAYDDFGCGRGRLQELVEVPPDYLKLGHRLVETLRREPGSVRGVVQGILGIADSVGARVIAEGPVSDREERICWELGFDLCQRHDDAPRDPAAAKRPTPLRLVRGRVGEERCLPTCA